MPSIKIPENLLTVIQKLAEKGFSAYLVGGCVRDFLLGKAPHDWDICTDALPEEVISCFRDYSVVPTGIAHGTVCVVINGEQYEITTFRREEGYTDSRRPDRVYFDANLIKDLSRRDFTINAIAYSPKEGIVDYFGGLSDLKAKTIDCVGNPDERFGEDALRILRAIRFASVLGFEIGKDTKESILKNAYALHKISAERKREELFAFISGENCKKLMLEYRIVFESVFPEILKDDYSFKPTIPPDVWEYTSAVVSNCSADKITRLAGLLYNANSFYTAGIDKINTAREIMNGLKFDNKTKARVLTLIAYGDTSAKAEIPCILKLLNEIGKDSFIKLLELKKAIAEASLYGKAFKESVNHIEKVKAIANDIFSRNLCYSIKQLAINGKTLIDEGFPEGEQIGKILNDCLNQIISGNLYNTKNDILLYVRIKYK
ncbi:MAG: CCA tRNA nucleotidyltransferase [Clostridiales bacterium]|jgi:tRNA nucleotidyltransferase (CCA-adding enzyme)|nr:CCA tRNA nucleotidyltransferase [Clostridiales bacterium]